MQPEHDNHQSTQHNQPINTTNHAYSKIIEPTQSKSICHIKADKSSATAMYLPQLRIRNQIQHKTPKARDPRVTLVSSMTAQRIPVLSMAWRRLSSVSWWYSWEPWEKLKRATFMPARRSFSTMGTDRDAGPRVQTIFVFGLGSGPASAPAPPKPLTPSISAVEQGFPIKKGKDVRERER